MQFQKGQSGNPAGRPRGALNRVTLLAAQRSTPPPSSASAPRSPPLPKRSAFSRRDNGRVLRDLNNLVSDQRSSLYYLRIVNVYGQFHY